MNAPYHSTFTPSQSDPETLEDLFVAREKLAQRILDGIQESATGANKHQRLLIGPRGIGKTHLVALLHHRVRRDAELDDRLRIAWLPEDPYIAGYHNLLLLILQTLQQTYALETLRQRLEDVLDLEDANQAEPLLEQLLVEFVGDKTLLLIVENLDDLLANLKETGQRKLRAFLQNHPITTLLATATSLSEAVAERENTFHGFFKIHTLDPFTVEDAVRLLTRMAQRAGSDDLANALCSPMGRARVRAVHYLAGGNPRIYVVFYDFLTRESLDDLVRPFMKLIDELTPYYQARMDRLAPLQRSIIDIMRRLRGAVTIKEIARQAMNTSQTISAQLGKLKDLGYVIQAAALGRSNYYELREPLMRFCLEVKEQRGRTVELFVQFLRVWYSATELARLAPDGVISLEQTHLREAMQRAQSELDPVCSMLKTDFQTYLIAGNHQAALEAAELAIQRDNDDKESWFCKALCLEKLDHDLEEQLACWRQVTEIDPENGLAWLSQEIILSQLGRFEEALLASAKALVLKADNYFFNISHAWSLKRVGRHAEAQTYFDKAPELIGEPKTAHAWIQSGLVWVMDRPEEALRAFGKALELNPRAIDSWGFIWDLFEEQGRYRLWHRMAEQMTALLPEEPIFWFSFGIANAELGRYEAALTAYDRALKIDPELNKKGIPADLHRTVVLSNLGRHTAALEVLESTPAPASEIIQFRHDLVHADTLMWLDRWEEGCAELDDVLNRFAPGLWTGWDLYIITKLIRGTQNPAIWKRFISVWLELFARHERLTKLGQGLVWRIRALTLPWISDSVARAWHDTWQELAGDLEEMALPLRLLKAGVDYKATRNPQVLLALAQEERRLLEPWLINLFKEEPDEIDREMENLLHVVKQRLTRAVDSELMPRAATTNAADPPAADA
ncbi:tetratricopeptide repeat protein [Candidatus Competibacter phosphatis]|uniref:Tetratricopeptide repeat protein n=1 Tax=Candidatus Competibacter phosphatis TaxID=221280 RepID=A0ABX1TJY5_9GAMM|nr:tetratricopeptide repeat protein [Candidatus Competibacter phosphatis]NMQ18874.1 tetratricopeptide repeat protein [Candidatus Competibacter phosphatis]